MSTPNLPMRERIAEALAVAMDADYWVGEIRHWEALEGWERNAYPDEYPGMAYEDRNNYRTAADAVLAVLADLPDTAVEAGARALTEPEPIPGAKTLGCARHHRVIFNNGCPACNKEARAVLIAAFKEGKA